MAQAAAAKARVSATIGTPLRIHHDQVTAFPTPDVLADLAPMRGVSQVKADRLCALGPAVVDSDLTATSLRADDEAMERLLALDGVGPFSAELALVRGAGAPDRFPRHERRLHAIMRDRYGLDDAPIQALEGVAEQWRPFRSWASLLLRTDDANDG
jgi:DNA-3-methyladenine glycosylase II